jgi:predicted ATP-dependent endonuclease of OLD family
MNRAELVRHLKSFRNAWERVTERNQDLSDERLKEETVVSLRKLLKHYYSDESNRQAEDWLDLSGSESESDYSNYESDTSPNQTRIRSLWKKFSYFVCINKNA